MQMRHHERRRHDLEAEHPRGCGFLDGRPGQRAQALALQIRRNPAQHFGQICPGATARVQDVHVVCGQAVRNAEGGFQRLVHAGDHVAHDFCRHVPDAQLFAQGEIEGSQEGFVEARDDVACIEAGEEGGAVHAVEGRGGLGQDFDKPQRVEPPRVGDLLEQRLQNIGVRRSPPSLALPHKGRGD